MKKLSIIKVIMAFTVLVFSTQTISAQWFTTGNTGIGAANYIGTQNNAPLRIATNAGATYTNLADLRMIVTQDGSVGIGRGDGTNPPTTPLNKLLIENGTIFDPLSAQGDIYQRITSQLPIPSVESDFGLISYSNNTAQDGNNFAIVGFCQNPQSFANVGVIASAQEGQSNVGTIASGMNGLSNTGLLANAGVDSPYVVPNSSNLAIQANARGEDGADNRGIQLDVTGRIDANTNTAIEIDVDGDNATTNEGIILNVSAAGTSTDNNGYRMNINNSSASNNNTGFNTNMSAEAGNDNTGASLFMSGTAGNRNRGYVTTVNGSSPNNTGSEIYVSGASNNNTGEQINVSGGGTFNLGLNIQVQNTTSGNGSSGITSTVTGSGGATSHVAGGFYGDAGGSDWVSGVYAMTHGSTRGNAGVFGSADGIDYGNAWNIGVQGEVLNPGNYLNYAVYGDYVVSGNNGADYAGFFNGSVYTSALYYSSDPKLKENVRDYKGALEQLNKLDIKNYTYKKEYAAMNLPEGVQIGVMANNLREVFPNLVKKAIYPGSIRDKQDVTFDAVNTNALVPVLVQAVKELDAKNVATDELKKEVDALKADKAAVAKELEAVKTDNESLKKDMADMKNMLDKICSNGCGDFKPASTLGGTTGSESNLFQNVPNPFSNTTVIPYTIGQGVKQAVLIVTDLNGTELKRFSTSQAGSGTFEVNMGDLGTGTYIYSLFTDGKLIDTKKMVLAGK